MNLQSFTQTAPNFFVRSDYTGDLESVGLTSLEAVFSFEAGLELNKDNLADYRNRLQFEIGSPAKTLFLKRYEHPPVMVQLKNWLTHRSRRSMMSCDRDPAEQLAASGIPTPRTVAFGRQWGLLFEKRSFIISEKIPCAHSLERKLPPAVCRATDNSRTSRNNFIRRLGRFVNRFHRTGFRHRDLYFAHIFYSDRDGFYLIDLHRAFKPALLCERYRVKDIAQLHYSAPRRCFTNTDRLRFYLTYADIKKLGPRDKTFIRSVIRKARKMARHDARHNRPAPFAQT